MNASTYHYIETVATFEVTKKPPPQQANNAKQETKQEEKQTTKVNEDEEGEEPEKQNKNQVSILQSLNKKNLTEDDARAYIKLQGASKMQAHKKQLEAYLAFLMQDDQKMTEFMRNIQKIKL